MTDTCTYYTDNKRYYQNFSTQHYPLERDLKTDEYADAIVLPIIEAPTTLSRSHVGGVLDSEGNWVAGQLVRGDGDVFSSIDQGYSVSNPKGIPYIGETVIYAGGSDKEQFGHYVTERLSRLWCFLSDESPKKRIVFSGNPGRTISPTLLELLNLVGIGPDDVYYITEPTRFSSIIVPEQAFYTYGGPFHRESALLVFNEIAERAEPTEIEKVYFSRSGIVKPFQATINESKLEKFFKEQGYHIFRPELLTMHQQISLIAGAREFASTFGSISHLIPVAQAGTKVSLFLRDDELYPSNAVQWLFCGLRELPWSLVNTTMKLIPATMEAGAVMFTNTKQWQRFTAEEFGVDEGSEAPDSDIAEYMRQWAKSIPDTLYAGLDSETDGYWQETGTLTDRATKVKIADGRLRGSPRIGFNSLAKHVSRSLLGVNLSQATLDALRVRDELSLRGATIHLQFTATTSENSEGGLTIRGDTIVPPAVSTEFTLSNVSCRISNSSSRPIITLPVTIVDELRRWQLVIPMSLLESIPDSETLNLNFDYETIIHQIKRTRRVGSTIKTSPFEGKSHSISPYTNVNGNLSVRVDGPIVRSSVVADSVVFDKDDLVIRGTGVPPDSTSSDGNIALRLHGQNGEGDHSIPAKIDSSTGAWECRVSLDIVIGAKARTLALYLDLAYSGQTYSKRVISGINERVTVENESRIEAYENLNGNLSLNVDGPGWHVRRASIIATTAKPTDALLSIKGIGIPQVSQADDLAITARFCADNNLDPVTVAVHSDSSTGTWMCELPLSLLDLNPRPVKFAMYIDLDSGGYKAAHKVKAPSIARRISESKTRTEVYTDIDGALITEIAGPGWQIPKSAVYAENIVINSGALMISGSIVSSDAVSMLDQAVFCLELNNVTQDIISPMTLLSGDGKWLTEVSLGAFSEIANSSSVRAWLVTTAAGDEIKLPVLSGLARPIDLDDRYRLVRRRRIRAFPDPDGILCMTIEQ
ncbi:MAG: glycosyltransferase family 61 protein [Cellulomonadaceae bacterium]|jgi:hypothetical protein|nr:glycosyltransferase family 61 protein [Cellulomonadaceae bacterium]